MKLRVIAVMSLLLAVCAGCGTDNPTDKTQSCTGDADCDPGFHCGADNKCVQECDPSGDGADCPEGESCSSLGRCQVAGECLVDEDCDSPPSDATCDGDALIAYNQVGTCDMENGETVCNYSETRTTCENGCLGGACVPDPCAELTCETPPSPVCDADGTTLIEFSDPGACVEGVCEYMETPTSCALGCQGGACSAGTCDSVVCNMPPEDECDDDTAITYAPDGECIDVDGSAVCDYQPTFDNCEYRKTTCSNALCGQGITQVGGVLITEYMPNPVESFNDLGEWIEITNTSGADIDLNSGWLLRSKGSGDDEEHAFAGAPNFPAGGTLTLVYSDNVPFDYDYNYDDVRLANNTDWFELVNPAGEIVDYVFYERGSILTGRSRKLDPSAPQDVDANDDFSNWCPSMSDEYEVGPPSNYGTPGADNTACAADPCADFMCEQPSDFCNTRTNTAVQYIDQSVMCEATRFNNPFCNFDTNEVECTDGTQLCAYGVCETIPSNLPAPGELILSEVMPNPESYDSDREWIEVYNTTGAPLAVFSMIFEDNELATSNNEYQFLDIDVEIPANGYVAFARNQDPAENGGLPPDVELYAGAHLKNNPDPADDKTPPEGMKLLLTLMDGTVIDEAYYDNPEDESAGFPPGQSMQLDSGSLDATSNDDAANWCFTPPAAMYGDGGAGSPGEGNSGCP